MFEPYLGLPARVPEAQFELAMNISPDDPERSRLQRLGWHVVDPHRVARTPNAYRRYMASALAEFTAIKGVDVAWQTGWLSDRAAAFLALGRPVITEDTGAARYLPRDSGFRFIRNIDEAEDGGERSVARLAAAIETGASVRRGGFRFGKESWQNPQSLRILPRPGGRRLALK